MADAATKTFSEEEYLAVPMSSLIHRKAALSDLYIRLGTGRMVKVAHKGGAIDVERIERLSDGANVPADPSVATQLSAFVTAGIRGAMTSFANCATEQAAEA